VSFTRAQQPELRAYLGLAWQAHCQAEGIDAGGRCRGSKRCGACAYCAWYEEVLEGATGHRSTTECNAGRDYDRFMRDLEAIHGQSIKWQMRAFGGDARRILHQIGEVCAEHGIDEDYLRAVARRGFGPTAELHLLEAGQLLVVLGEVKRHVRRQAKRAKEEDTNEPF
jgi:hypothetical protein